MNLGRRLGIGVLIAAAAAAIIALMFYLDPQFGTYVYAGCNNVRTGWQPTQHQVQIVWLGLISIAIWLWYGMHKYMQQYHGYFPMPQTLGFIALIVILTAGLIGTVIGWEHPFQATCLSV